MAESRNPAAWKGPLALAVAEFLAEMGFSRRATSGGCCVFWRKPIGSDDPHVFLPLTRGRDGRVSLVDLDHHVFRRCKREGLFPSDWEDTWKRHLAEVNARERRGDPDLTLDFDC